MLEAETTIKIQKWLDAYNQAMQDDNPTQETASLLEQASNLLYEILAECDLEEIERRTKLTNAGID
jgi:hypothetical protein